MNSPKAISEILRPQSCFIPSRFKVSIAILSYLRTRRSANLKNQSRLRLAISLCTRARCRFARNQPLERVCKVFVTGCRGGVSPPDSEALFGRGDLAPTMLGVVFSHLEVNFDKIFTHPLERYSLRESALFAERMAFRLCL